MLNIILNTIYIKRYRMSYNECEKDEASTQADRKEEK